MLHRRMPKSGDELSILGFGAMRLPQKDGAIDEPRAIAQIRQAIDLGVNYVDTAWPYHGGQSEVLVGKALKDGYRAKVKLATKLPSWLLNSREDMDVFLNAQLEKLGTDHIDYYLVHALDGPIWDKVRGLGVLEFLEAAKRDGRIVNAGFSFHGLLPDFKRIVDGYPWTFCQIQYNYLDQEFQAGTEGLQYAAGRGLGLVIMEPLRGGNLANPEPVPAIAEIWDKAEVKRSPVEWALRWVWNHPEVTLLLSGMNSEEQVAQNAALAGTALPESLSAAELDIVNQVARKYRELTPIGCTGCGYCMPCPMGVQIPKCFDAYNKLHQTGNVDESKFMYVVSVSGMLGSGDPGYASQCVACGECLEKCPQSLPIPDLMVKVKDELEDGHMEERTAAAQRFFSNRPQ